MAASASDAFHVVIPSMPGYGFSGKPTTTGWDCTRIARAWTVLMKRLGYTRYVAQGGDWGALDHGADGRAGAPGIARHPYQLAFRRTSRNSEGARVWEQPAARPLGRRKPCVRTARLLLYPRPVVRPADGEPPADAVRDCGFTGRARRLVPRPRPAELRAHRTRLRRATRRPHARRRSRQHHDHVADQHGDFRGSSLSGEQASLLRCRWASRSPLP